MGEDKEKPASVLFVCTMNAVRSPMAAALLRQLKGREIYVESAGVDAGAPDPLAIEAMAEIGIALTHRPRRFEDLQDDCFDLIVALSPEAERRARDWGRHHRGRILAYRRTRPRSKAPPNSAGPHTVPYGTRSGAKSRRGLAEIP